MRKVSVASGVEYVLCQSPAALEPGGGTHDGNGLVHHPLADAEVVIDPSLDFLVF
jgi:hypothetical protein